jgi:hypothetical protein
MPASSSSAQTLGSTRGRSRSPTRRVNGSILTRVDPRTVDVVDRIDVHAPLDDVTVGSGAVWATSGPASSALRLDREGRVTFRIPIASKPGAESPYPFAVATGAGSIWVQGYGGLRRGRSGLVDRQRDVRPMPGHGLTHAGPGTAADEPGSYYPRGVRNFARVMAADDARARRTRSWPAPSVRSACSRSATGVPTETASPRRFTRAARRLGLTESTALWRYDAQSYAPLVADSG